MKRRRMRKRVTRERLERIFDYLWAQADAIIKAHSPCEVKIGKHGVSCLDCRVRHRPTEINILCCGGCKFHTKDKGCIADKPLTCRTWLCYSAQEAHPEAHRRLQDIASRMHRLGFYVGRGDKEDSIANAMAYFGLIPYGMHFHPTLAPG